MQSKYIINPIFISSLLILLINDFYFKYAFHNWITGKLSDIFGIIVFALFLTAFASKFKKGIFIITAIAFSFWKTPYSQPIIEFLNALEIIQFHRTIDYTDIICVLVLIFLYQYNPSVLFIKSKMMVFRFAKPVLVSITFFAILSTSQRRYIIPPSIKLDKNITIKMSKESFFNQLENDKINYQKDAILIVKRDTFDKYILRNVVLGYDTIQKITIGIKDKRNKTNVYIDSLVNRRKDGSSSITFDKKWLKKYKVDLIELLKNTNQ
ncbi:hypothetical protein [uncultured Aquimarina sp.]|uniref:hypothetical protein n=1 Tax=uncultured Aquimarina sp. TaxID=575652 RepID=UPI00261C2BD6|nr:hypothetical protein [uncultured Aquimarina sp.]